MRRKSETIRNIVFSFGGEALILLLGIAVPRVIIGRYGSDANGFLSTITQVFTYLALMEAGIGRAATNALHPFIAGQDREGISRVASAASGYFRRIALYYGAAVLGLSLLAPAVIRTELGRGTVILSVLLQGMADAIRFYFIQPLSVLLAADGKSYVNNGVRALNRALGYAAKIFLAVHGASIVLLQAAYLLITAARILFYRWYFRKHYSWLDWHSAAKTEKLPDRNFYVVSELAWTIFSSTDMIVLSVFLSTRLASVYSVYSLVFTSLHTILLMMFHSVSYLLGQAFHQDRERYLRLHDAFTSVFFGGMTALMCTAYMLTIPFIRLYTRGISDIGYADARLPLLFCLVQMLSWSRCVTGNLSGVAGYAKPVSRVSLAEAVCNAVLSVALVRRFGIFGVLAATVVSLPLKVVYLTWLSERVILNRNTLRYPAILGSNFALFGLAVLVNRFLPLQVPDVRSFLAAGAAVFILCCFAGAAVNGIVNPDALRAFRQFVRKKG